MKARHKFYTKPAPLARFVQEICEEREVSFTDACLEMDISTSTISNLARSRYKPSLSTLQAIAEWANRPLTSMLELAGYVAPPSYSDPVFRALMDRVSQLDDAGLHYLIDQADFWLFSRRKKQRRKG